MVGMVADPSNGGVLRPSTVYIREEMEKVSKQQDGDFPEVNVVEFEEAIDSSDIGTFHFFQDKLC